MTAKLAVAAVVLIMLVLIGLAVRYYWRQPVTGDHARPLRPAQPGPDVTRAAPAPSCRCCSDTGGPCVCEVDCGHHCCMWRVPLASPAVPPTLAPPPDIFKGSDTWGGPGEPGEPLPPLPDMMPAPTVSFAGPGPGGTWTPRAEPPAFKPDFSYERGALDPYSEGEIARLRQAFEAPAARDRRHVPLPEARDLLTVWQPGSRILPSCQCGSYGHYDSQHEQAAAAWPPPAPSSHPYPQPAPPAAETCPDYDFGCALLDLERTGQILARAAAVDQAVAELVDDVWPAHVPWKLDDEQLAAA